jgi:hypothetical protein
VHRPADIVSKLKSQNTFMDSSVDAALKREYAKLVADDGTKAARMVSPDFFYFNSPVGVCPRFPHFSRYSILLLVFALIFARGRLPHISWSSSSERPTESSHSCLPPARWHMTARMDGAGLLPGQTWSLPHSISARQNPRAHSAPRFWTLAPTRCVACIR